MAPIKRKTSKNSKRVNTSVQTKAKTQERKNVPSDIEETEDAYDDSNCDFYKMIAVGRTLAYTFKLSKKADCDKLEEKVQDYFVDEDEDENIFDMKPNNQEHDNLYKSMKYLDLSDNKGRSRRSQKDLNSTPARKTRSSISQTINEFQTPSRTRSGKKISNNEGCQTPSESGRNLRVRRSIINYNENDKFTSPGNSTKRNQIRRESSGIELCETPQKQVTQRRKSPRKPLASVNENDQSFEASEESSPITRQKVRGKKNIADPETDFAYEGTPRKRKSTVASVLSAKKTPSKSRTTTPGRKKILTTEKSSTKSPGKGILGTPRSSAMTPKGIRALTPSMHQRSVNVPKPKTNLQEFRTRLHVSFVPKSLPCREAEFNNIFTFLKGKLTEEIGGCIYISGVPGTGKTATVNEVISCLKKLESLGELPTFEFVDINGMKLTEPRQAYVQIKKKLTGISNSWEESHRYLHHRFTTPASRRNMTLLLIDEMDLLCTKRQDVVYNLLDWPTYKASHLVVITIANTMDLPERILMSRVTSRLGLTRVTFQPYNHTQLMEIVKTRLKDADGFKREAIELVSRKVASVSGDARRALDICRRATEIAENNNKEFVTIVDVTSALNEMIANPRVQAIKCCSMMEQKFLEAICNEVSRTGMEQVTFKNIYKQFETVCLIEGEEVPNITQTLEICRKLASWRLILWESGADLYQSILLNVSPDDIYFSRHKIA